MFAGESGTAAKSPFRLLLGALGDTRMLALLDVYAGVRIKIPTKPPTMKSALAQKLGLDTAAILHSLLAGNTIDVPVAKWFRIRAMREAGKSYSQIASRLCMTEGTVCRHLRNAGLTRNKATVRSLRSDATDLTKPQVLP